MKSVVAAAIAIQLLVIASPAAAALKAGEPAPDFSAQGAQDGKPITVDLRALLKKGPVVLYFFPSAFTDSSESRDFAANEDKFRAAGASIVGVSRDSVDTLMSYSTEQCAGKFPVVSADLGAVDAFDVNDGAMFNTRTTYVIAPSGTIVFVDGDAEPEGHARNALAFVQSMKK